MSSPRGETERRLLDAALTLFYDRGYDGASVNDIVTEAGVTAPTLYHHFGSKDGLLRAVIDPLLADVDDLATRASTWASSAESRTRILREYLEVLLRWRMAVCFVVDDPALRHHPEIGTRLQAQHLQLTKLLADDESSPEAIVAAVAALGAVWRSVIFLDEEKALKYSETIVGAASAALATVLP